MARIANTLVNDPDKIKTAAGLLMTMNGSPFVYYGEEIGMNSSGTKDENKRIPMVWSKTDTTGMTKYRQIWMPALNLRFRQKMNRKRIRILS